MPSRELSSSEKRDLGWTRLRTTIVALTALGISSELASYSLLTPFYPSVAKSKGNGATQIGFVMSVPSVVGLVCSPLAGKMISSGLSPRRAAILGLAIDGGFLISMLFLTMLESPLSFFVVSLLLRLGESIGLSLCFTTFYALISPQFPNNFELIVPFFEVCVGIGSMIGPAAGSFLFEKASRQHLEEWCLTLPAPRSAQGISGELQGTLEEHQITPESYNKDLTWKIFEVNPSSPCVAKTLGVYYRIAFSIF